MEQSKSYVCVDCGFFILKSCKVRLVMAEVAEAASHIFLNTLISSFDLSHLCPPLYISIYGGRRDLNYSFWTSKTAFHVFC